MKFVIKGKLGRERYFVDGKKVTKKKFDKLMEAARPKVSAAPLGGTFNAEATWNRPVVSDSLGIHPCQLKRRLEVDRKLGVPVEFKTDADGWSYSPVFRSRAEQLRYLKAHALHNKHEVRG